MGNTTTERHIRSTDFEMALERLKRRFNKEHDPSEARASFRSSGSAATRGKRPKIYMSSKEQGLWLVWGNLLAQTKI